MYVDYLFEQGWLTGDKDKEIKISKIDDGDFMIGSIKSYLNFVNRIQSDVDAMSIDPLIGLEENQRRVVDQHKIWLAILEKILTMNAAMNVNVDSNRRQQIIDLIDQTILMRRIFPISTRKQSAIVLKLSDGEGSTLRLTQDLKSMLSTFDYPFVLQRSLDGQSALLRLPRVYFKALLDWLDIQSSILKSKNIEKVHDERRLAMYKQLIRETQGPEEDFGHVGDA